MMIQSLDELLLTLLPSKVRRRMEVERIEQRLVHDRRFID